MNTLLLSWMASFNTSEGLVKNNLLWQKKKKADFEQKCNYNLCSQVDIFKGHRQLNLWIYVFSSFSVCLASTKNPSVSGDYVFFIIFFITFPCDCKWQSVLLCKENSASYQYLAGNYWCLLKKLVNCKCVSYYAIGSFVTSVSWDIFLRLTCVMNKSVLVI